MTITLLNVNKTISVLTGLKSALEQNSSLGLKNQGYYGTAKESHKTEFLHGVNLFQRFMTSIHYIAILHERLFNVKKL